MARFMELLTSGQFATGVAYYEDLYPNDDDNNRIVLSVTVEGQLSIKAIVDTGAPWCIVDPTIVEAVGIDIQETEGSIKKMFIRGIKYDGKLIRMYISIDVNEGETVDVDATVFVPLLRPGEGWWHPNFLGLDGFLNRILFAVDPTENTFYIGTM